MFQNIVLPDNLIPLSENIVNQIMMDNYSFLCMYEEPRFFKQFVDHFFKSHEIEFKKMYDTVLLEYNPIENYDRVEDGTSENWGKDDYTNTNSGKDVTTNTISAMNSSEFQNDTKSQLELGTSMTHGDKYDNNNKYHSRTHGNIGVTTSQQMIEQERRVAEFNILQYISDKFGHELMIRVC